MPLKAACFCRYQCNCSIVWRPCDHDAHKFIQAIKGSQLNGWAWIPVGRVSKRLSNQNLPSAVEWFAEFAVAYLARQKIKAPFSLVPIPNSACVSLSARPSAGKLARAIRDRLGEKAGVLDCLRWKRNLGSASKEGGPREPKVLHDNLVVLGKPRKGTTACLIDDVMTSGGHLRACAARLRAQGVEVALAVCVGRTVYDQERDAFDIMEETLEDFNP